ACDYAIDGEEAIKKIDAYPYDLILLDIMLPKISGFELMDYIRFLKIPVIFLTAKADVKDRVAGLKLGAEDYLTKPFEMIELLARVETVLRRYNKLALTFSVLDITLDTVSHT
ncbi:MAG: response regulator, partial [Oscillospiraceae bacterium]